MVKILAKLQRTMEKVLVVKCGKLKNQCKGALGMNVAMNVGTFIKVN
jgi:hypothetical protein